MPRGFSTSFVAAGRSVRERAPGRVIVSPVAPPGGPLVKPGRSNPGIIERTSGVGFGGIDLLRGGVRLETAVFTPKPPTPKRQVQPVSIHRDIISGLGGLVGEFGTTAVNALQNRLRTSINPSAQANIFAAGPAVIAGGRAVIGAAGRVLSRPGVQIGATAAALGATMIAGRNGGGACPVGFHPNKQRGVHGEAGTYCVRNRRMNVSNARAARRSVRRLKGARKLLRDIEKMMPSKTTRRRAPQHHHHPAAGG